MAPVSVAGPAPTSTFTRTAPAAAAARYIAGRRTGAGRCRPRAASATVCSAAAVGADDLELGGHGAHPEAGLLVVAGQRDVRNGVRSCGRGWSSSSECRDRAGRCSRLPGQLTGSGGKRPYRRPRGGGSSGFTPVVRWVPGSPCAAGGAARDGDSAASGAVSRGGRCGRPDLPTVRGRDRRTQVSGSSSTLVVLLRAGATPWCAGRHRPRSRGRRSRPPRAGPRAAATGPGRPPGRRRRGPRR